MHSNSRVINLHYLKHMKRTILLLTLSIPIIAWFFLLMTGLFLSAIASSLIYATDWIENKINKL